MPTLTKYLFYLLCIRCTSKFLDCLTQLRMCPRCKYDFWNPCTTTQTKPCKNFQTRHNVTKSCIQVPQLSFKMFTVNCQCKKSKISNCRIMTMVMMMTNITITSYFSLTDQFSVLNGRDVQNRFFKFWFGFWKKSDSVQNDFCLVRFNKMWFGSDIIVIYYSCNSEYYSDRGWHDFDVTDIHDNK